MIGSVRGPNVEVSFPALSLVVIRLIDVASERLEFDSLLARAACIVEVQFSVSERSSYEI